LERWAWLLVLAYLAGAFLAVNYWLPGNLTPGANMYAAQPAMWGLLAVLSLMLVWRARETQHASARVVVLAMLAAAFQVAWLVGAGALFGFGYSPYAHAPLKMAANGLYLGTLVAGVEFSRAYLIAAWHRRMPWLALPLVSILYAVLLVPAASYGAIVGPRTGFEVTGQTLLPGLAQSIMASYLAELGGPLPALTYHGGMLAFQWFSPVLPALEWTVAAFIGTVGPVVSVLLVRASLVEPADVPNDARRHDVSAVWVVGSVLFVALLWFDTGMFGVQPAIVSGVSMKPTMSAGDVVITRHVSADDISLGDIVRYRSGHGTPILHRVIEIEDVPGGRVFVTQGDNNNTPDEPVLASQVEGKVILIVPKVGWVPIALNKLIRRAL